MQLILYTADCTGNAKNCKYPHRAVVTSADELQDAVGMDHVCAEYQGNYRSVDNFVSSNVVVMDCDNDHSEDPAEWITPEKLEEIFSDGIRIGSKQTQSDREGRESSKTEVPCLF